MHLTDAEKEAFLQSVTELLSIDVITKDVRDEICRVMMVACVRALQQDNNGADAE